MSGKRRGLVVAIDGPSGVGKSTVSRLVARRLGFRRCDTGAMYRAFAVAASENGVDTEDERALEEFSRRVEISFDDGERVFLNGCDYTEKIREAGAGRLASVVSTKGVVRSFLVAAQRGFGAAGSVVMEGRDIGTVVFPDAEVKIFLDAPQEVRAKRRYNEISGTGGGAGGVEDVAREMEQRDERDATRAHSPLKRAGDAVYIDTGAMTIAEVVDRILEVVKERSGAGSAP